MVKQKNDPLRLVWIDLEMTGLDPDKHVILEIATLITDGDLQLLAEGPSLAISRESDDLDQMNSWNVTTHTGSGLIERVTSSEISIADAEKMTLDFLEQWVLTLRERGNRDGKGLFRSSSERGHGDGGVM